MGAWPGFSRTGKYPTTVEPGLQISKANGAHEPTWGQEDLVGL